MSRFHLIALSFVKHLGPVSAKALLQHFGDAEAIFKMSPVSLAKVPGIGLRTADRFDFNAALKAAEKEIRYAEANNVDIILHTDDAYPWRLKNCDDSPIVLYGKGNYNLNTQRVVSIVGTRNATDYGKHLCAQLIEELKQYDVLIVSGLALGIDTAAHKESLRCGLSTVGVLGHGLSNFYPASNRNLANKMQDNGGILTEYAWELRAMPENFPSRNRIVAGMADATVVVEAGIKGGALITAEIANSYNRDVFAFPGRIGDEVSEGCNFLIRHNKAHLLTCIADLAFSMGWDQNTSAKPKEQMALPLDLPPNELLIYDIIRQNRNPIAIDNLAIKTDLPMSQLAMNLLNMEMMGYIRSLPGKMYNVN